MSGTAEGPGEIAGPALQVTLTVRNDSDAAVSLRNGLVNLYYGADASPGRRLSGPGAVDFPTEVAAGSSVRGVFVFGVPKSQRKVVAVEFSYAADRTTVIFQGSA